MSYPAHKLIHVLFWIRTRIYMYDLVLIFYIFINAQQRHKPCLPRQNVWKNVSIILVMYSIAGLHTNTLDILEEITNESILIIRPPDSALHIHHLPKIDHLFYLLIAGVCSVRYDRTSANISLTWSARNSLGSSLEKYAVIFWASTSQRRS